MFVGVLLQDFQTRAGVSDQEALKVDEILLRIAFVFVENFLGELRYVVS